MDACTKGYIMIYAHKNYKLEVRRDKGKFYSNDKLVFQGFAFAALKMFIDNCNNDNVNDLVVLIKRGLNAEDYIQLINVFTLSLEEHREVMNS